MASGLPAVARRDNFPHIITSSASMIEDQTSGFLVSDEREMAGALATLLTDPQLRERMAAAAIRAARERFCWDRHLDAIDAALIELAGR
jgi:glycosyltransferase involved in cell wall biosynthesis